MAALRRCLYSFLGIHSLLIGLFPFYIPVYLYAHVLSLDEVCGFIALTGGGFCLSLYLWERAYKTIALRKLILLSFFIEFLLLSTFLLETNITFLILAGIINGVYSCNFWIIQRLLFLETVTSKNSGKKFGNFQIFVLIVLKAGIFIGGITLEASGFLAVYLVSLVLLGVAMILFLRQTMAVELDGALRACSPLSVSAILRYKDSLNSRTVFAIDGAFLYLESYFWVISLYLLVKESFWRLGLLVVLLALFFGVLFIIIKNSIDRIEIQFFYRVAVILYAVSWLLRSVLIVETSMLTLLLLLASITFCTSLFRLAFNKRFFDNARTAVQHEYIFIKSYYSQFFLIPVFGLPLLISLPPGNVIEQLSYVYIAAASVAFLYLIYGADVSNMGRIDDR